MKRKDRRIDMYWNEWRIGIITPNIHLSIATSTFYKHELVYKFIREESNRNNKLLISYVHIHKGRRSGVKKVSNR